MYIVLKIAIFNKNNKFVKECDIDNIKLLIKIWIVLFIIPYNLAIKITHI